jgi:glycogen debranching enzyme
VVIKVVVAPPPRRDPDASSGWDKAVESVPLGEPESRVMLVAGQTFCLSDRSGNISSERPHGLFVADTRVLSHLRLAVGGAPIEVLGVAHDEAWRATFVGRVRPREGLAATDLLVLLRRSIGDSLEEQIELRNPHDHVRTCRLRLEVAADFADLFSVKEGRTHHHGRHWTEVRDGSLCLGWELNGVRREAIVSADGTSADVDLAGFTWTLSLPPRGSSRIGWSVEVALGERDARRSLGPLTGASRGDEHQRHWLEEAPTIDTDNDALARAYRRAVADLGSLRLFDPGGRRRPVIAAGAPWFMTLFGRDSLWTSYMALPIDPTLALGVLDALAELQGEDLETRTEEEPGRIMHETRFNGANTLALEGGHTYYGSVDATPLFVVLLGELARWGLPRSEFERLLPNADRALAWIEDFGDRDGDGYVEYLRANPRGLANQGWKDSWDAIRHRDGSLAMAPVALCEVQGYVYAAYLARVYLAGLMGDQVRVRRFERKAAALKEAFNRDFWVDELGWFAIGLDRDKQPISALASNMGHCLWAGIVDDDRIEQVVDHLRGPAMWSGWGVRTMAASEVAYDPTSYHCGTVWPHDSAIVTAGVAANGAAKHAEPMVLGLLAAADRWEGRLPELFLGLARDDVSSPVPYPTSCSPQAWSAAAPLLLLRVLLGLSPDLPARRVTVAPRLPERVGTLHLRGLRLWDGRFDVRCEGGNVEVTGLTEDVKASYEPGRHHPFG